MAQVTFYSASGSPVAYTQDETHIYLFNGTPVAYLHDSSVYTFAGRHLGRFANGWVRDNAGGCVFFTEHASGGPLKPLNSLTIPLSPAVCRSNLRQGVRARRLKPHGGSVDAGSIGRQAV